MWLYKKEDVECFVDGILRRAERKTNPIEEWVPLSTSPLSTQMTHSKIIAEVLKGHLRPIDTGEDAPLFQRLVLIRSELKQFRNKCDSPELLNMHEASVRLSVSYDVLRRWMNLGLLRREYSVFDQRRQVFLREEAVNSFQQTYMSSQEIRDRLRVKLSTVIKCIKQDTLHLVNEHKTYGERNVFLFLREEVESQRDAILQADNRRQDMPIIFPRPAMSLTVRETAEQLRCGVPLVYHLSLLDEFRLYDLAQI